MTQSNFQEAAVTRTSLATAVARPTAQILTFPPKGLMRADGTCRGHRGELLQGAAWLGDKRKRFLIDLPDNTVGSEASLDLWPGGTGKVTIHPDTYTKAKRAIELLIQRKLGGRHDALLRLTTRGRVGRGYGTSSSDVLAAIRAFERAATGVCLGQAEIGSLLVEAEQASNPIHVDQPCVFAHREGLELERFAAFPPLLVLGFDDPTLDDVLTDGFARARYTERQFEAFGTLIKLGKHACTTGDCRSLGVMATRSAEINQEYLPKRLNVMMAVLSKTGGVGVAVSHSGSVAALLFDGRDGQAELRLADAAQRLARDSFGDFAHWHLG